MFKSLCHLIFPALLCVLVACTSAPPVKVNTDYDPAIHFGKYHTFAIDSAATGLSATGTAALHQALQTNLAARGMKEVSGGNADLYIVPTVFTKEKLNVMPGGGYSIYPSRFGSYGPGSVQLNASVQEYTEGSLVLDFVDSKTHKIVFRGLAQAAVGSTERNAAAIAEAVNKIVAKYPSF